MNIFNRLFKIGQSEAHAAIDKLEDPIKLTEQGIRDMKVDLDKSLQALAEVKAMVIRSNGDIKKYKDAATGYEGRAVMLLKRAESGELEAAEADRLATEALMLKEENLKHVEQAQKEKAQYDTSVAQLESNVKKMRSNIAKWENELKTLKARVRVSSATKNINKQLAQIDSGSTVAMLEKMKDKVAQEEALAESYGEIANESRSIDEEIDQTLASSASSERSDELAKLKAKLGMNKEQS